MTLPPIPTILGLFILSQIWEGIVLFLKEGFYMKHALKYNDGTSATFWWIDYSGSDLCINHGPCKSVGTYELIPFQTAELCRQEGESRVSTQLKMGFIEDPDFDFFDHIYVDSEVGIHPKTSHPSFVEQFSNTLYYSESREFAPFGNKIGKNVLRFIEGQLMAQKELNFANSARWLTSDIWGQTYIPVDTLERTLVQEQSAKQKDFMAQSDITTFAMAFAQIKTSGQLNGVLKQKALSSLQRFILLHPTSKKCCELMYDNLFGFSPTSY